ncbi:hypothetical protein H1P_440005 [Hyella patelloides LEGE 07179]|uniref:Uncharacterized protein n=1 Tax=Hyella patelloides LEGE 07179 TaxID=945734 RepID=A0A563VY79_9CYAN|nr:hypothetical protein [Hyella patelloides]VEP16347.1 hypothetical protein H1P_440005 [Hyella patelloides LEGE 07179]
MNHSKFNLKSQKTNNNQIDNVEQKNQLWLNKFWQFSLFYGNHLGSLHSKR